MNIAVKDLGTCNYNIALSTQEITREKLIQNSGVNTLFLVEHDHIYTLGKHANPKNILNNNCEIIQTDRGGDVTYHGPGQLVGYPIIDLKKMKLGVKSYVKNIESLPNNAKKYIFAVEDFIGAKISEYLAVLLLMDFL